MWPSIMGLVYYVGIGAHALMAAWWGQRLRLRAYVPVAVSVCYLLGMTVGAKALFDLRAGQFSVPALLRPEHYRVGGMWSGPVAYLALAVPVGLLLTRQRRAVLDLIALAAPIPIAIGKFSCLCAGCCHGKPTNLPWAITFSPGNPAVPGGVPLHPTQVYDMLVLLTAAGLLWWVERGCETLDTPSQRQGRAGFSHHRTKAGKMSAPPNKAAETPAPLWRGTLLAWLVGWCSLGRMLTDFTRPHPPAQTYWGSMTPFQWLCAAAAIACAAALAVHATRPHRPASAT